MQIWEVESRLPAFGFDVLSEQGPEPAQTDLLLQSLDMGPLSLPLSLPISLQEHMVDVPQEGLQEDLFPAMGWGPPSEAGGTYAMADRPPTPWVPDENLPVDNLPNWSTSWYHLGPKDLALTAVPHTNSLRPTADKFRLSKAQSPFSCGSNQSELVHGHDTSLHHQYPRSISSHEAEASAMRMSPAMLSRASSNEVARRQSQPNIPFPHAYPMSGEGMPRTRSEFLPSDVDIHSFQPDFLTAHMRESYPTQHHGSLQWSDHEALSSETHDTRGAEAWTMNRASSTPMPQISTISDSGGKTTKRRSKRSGRDAEFRTLESDPTPLLVPVVQSTGNSIRVVSGKGEFDFPAWKPSAKKPEAKRVCMTIRSNELGKIPRKPSLED